MPVVNLIVKVAGEATEDAAGDQVEKAKENTRSAVRPETGTAFRESTRIIVAIAVPLASISENLIVMEKTRETRMREEPGIVLLREEEKEKEKEIETETEIEIGIGIEKGLDPILDPGLGTGNVKRYRLIVSSQCLTLFITVHVLSWSVP